MSHLTNALRTSMLVVALATTTLGQSGTQEVSLNPTSIAAAQEKSRWCWAACAEMLARSQGIDVDQTYFVEKVFGPRLPNWPTGGRFAPIARALRGTYKVGNTSVRLDAAYNYGVPTNAQRMIKSIKEGRPFIVVWKGHALVCYGLKYRTGPQAGVVELKLIDPYWEFGSPKYRTFNVHRDPATEIDGTLELLVQEEEADGDEEGEPEGVPCELQLGWEKSLGRTGFEALLYIDDERIGWIGNVGSRSEAIDLGRLPAGSHNYRLRQITGYEIDYLGNERPYVSGLSSSGRFVVSDQTRRQNLELMVVHQGRRVRSSIN